MIHNATADVSTDAQMPTKDTTLQLPSADAFIDLLAQAAWQHAGHPFALCDSLGCADCPTRSPHEAQEQSVLCPISSSKRLSFAARMLVSACNSLHRVAELSAREGLDPTGAPQADIEAEFTANQQETAKETARREAVRRTAAKREASERRAFKAASQRADEEESDEARSSSRLPIICRLVRLCCFVQESSPEACKSPVQARVENYMEDASQTTARAIAWRHASCYPLPVAAPWLHQGKAFGHSSSLPGGGEEHQQ